MTFKSAFNMALDSLIAHRVRASLTMLGIIIGTSTVILTLAIGAGAREQIERQINSLGVNLIALNSGPPRGPGATPVALYLDDARAILNQCSAVAVVAPQQESRFTISHGSAQLDNNFVMGVTAAYAETRRATLAEGRFISEADDQSAAKVVVLGATVKQYLFGDGGAVGQSLRVHGLDCAVIGVLAERGDTPGLGPGMSTDERVFVPLAALQKRLLGTSDLRLIAVTARDRDSMPLAAQQIRELLNARHPINNFEIKSQNELLATSSSISDVITAMLTAIAAVSLLVGGIGIMNIMLVSVTERTREIGVRRAIGARRRAIMAQFLFEALMLSLAGGAVGVACGLGGASLLSAAFQWPARVSLEAILLALGFSSGVGIFFGFYPARRASGLNLADSLRYE